MYSVVELTVIVDSVYAPAPIEVVAEAERVKTDCVTVTWVVAVLGR
jgi:hypothetical protein